ncbi:MAG TPA: filamentous hemagglutinin [Cyanobacteria bacterium UBA8803]|nr:filamentous hemagglutinin [Cyanobacteria bacterium UBA9273]HBL61500.1 filamentous hemagglutinin [Cyanobacteria bacterium UBA8803]
MTMTRKQFKVARGWGLGEPITLMVCFVTTFWASYVLAQITPDGTLGLEHSVVTPNVNINGSITDRIDGGAIRGANLFHSFIQFNVEDGQRVYFANPVGIENILTRVTGTSNSHIQGTIGVTGGKANLFLINPNGIIFGKNAQLDVTGSFVATTANAIQFGNQGFFSATEPETPSLLNIQPSAFFFNQISSGAIENRSITAAGVDGLGNAIYGLRVPDGQSLLLVGGNIAIDGGGVNALGGRVELVGVAGSGTIGLDINGNNLSLSFPEDAVRSNIFLTNKAVVNTSGEGGGEINVWGRGVTLNEGSQIVGTTLGEKAGGGLTVDASESVELLGTGFNNFERTFIAGGLSGKLRPFNPGTGLFTGTVGTGAAGAIAINTKELILRDGGIILSPTFSQGAGGSLTVRASESVEASGSGLITATLRGATGAAGSITVNTQQLIVRDGAVVATTTLGEGAGGEIVLRASESVEILRSPARILVPTGIATSTIGGNGSAGGIVIDTGRLIVRDGAQISAASGSRILDIPTGGRGGNLIVKASEFVEVTGFSDDNRFPSILSSSTDSTGDAGNVALKTRQLIIQKGARVSASSTFGTGNGGNLTIDASDWVQLIGAVNTRVIGASNIPNSERTGAGGGLYTQTRIAGNAGELTINTGYLLVQDGMTVSAITSAGRGGNITVTANTVEVVNGGQLRTTTEAGEDAGDIHLIVRDRVILTGADSGLLANTTEGSSGNGGSILIRNPNSVLIRDGARVAVDSKGTGVGGDIDIQAGSVTLENQASLLADTASKTGGNITLQLQDLLLLRNASKISTNAGTAQADGDGGNIGIDTGFIVAVPQEDSDITANAFQGQGGKINITATDIYGIEFRPNLTPYSDITASSDFGVDGVVDINKLDVDPVRGIAGLPSEPVHTEVAQDCQTAGGKASGSFANTGRGGLPSNPYEPLGSSEILADVQPPTQWTSNSASTATPSTSAQTNSKRIVEANGWRINKNGEVVLVAEIPAVPSLWGCRLR